MLHHHVLILGAGASGLCCALFAARRGRSVTVLDHGPVTARKLRISGGGRCNFTHLEATARDYASENPAFATSALARFTPWDAVGLLAELGLGYEEKNPGQLFCDQGAPALARRLEQACIQAGVQIHPRTRIRHAERQANHYLVRTDKGDMTCDSLVLALGGPSWPDAGATDLGLTLASSFGLRVIPPRPALVPLVLPPKDQTMCRELAGVSLPVELETNALCIRDDMLFTHKGISGPAVLRLSLHWTKGHAVSLNLLPGLDLEAHLREHRTARTKLKKHLASLIPARVAATLLPAELSGAPLCQLSNAGIRDVVQRLQRMERVPARTEGLARAEVTAGGVDTRAVSSKTMECRELPGLFLIGELLDVTGDLGGYNLQWAWSSAHAAAQYV